MTDKLDTLIGELRAQDKTLDLTGLEARVWQHIDVMSPGPRLMVMMQAVRALPVIVALLLGGAVGERAMTAQNELSVFSAMPAYSVIRLVR